MGEEWTQDFARWLGYARAQLDVVAQAIQHVELMVAILVKVGHGFLEMCGNKAVGIGLPARVFSIDLVQQLDGERGHVAQAVEPGLDVGHEERIALSARGCHVLHGLASAQHFQHLVL